MLEPQDLQAIGQLIAESEGRMSQKISKEISASEERMSQKISESEKFLLDEMERVRYHLDGKISRVETKIDNVEQYYRIQQMEDSTASLLFEISEQHDKRISALEQAQRCVAFT